LDLKDLKTLVAKHLHQPVPHLTYPIAATPELIDLTEQDDDQEMADVSENLEPNCIHPLLESKKEDVFICDTDHSLFLERIHNRYKFETAKSSIGILNLLAKHQF
jgi:hypothetical protein